MPDLIVALRDEIRKQARKEMRAALDKTKKLVATHRREIAKLKQQLLDANKRVTFLEVCERQRIATAKSAADSDLRFSAKSVRTHRIRIDCSASEYGKLLGVSAQTIYQWERGKTRPRKPQLAALAKLRTIGKKEARERLRLLLQKEGDGNNRG